MFNFSKQIISFLICDKIPKIGAELLASQSTISRLENQITQKEIKEIRRFFVNKFIQNYSQVPDEILLDIDGWDALTHGHQQLSLFHGYYGHEIYFPVLINEAREWLSFNSTTESRKFPRW